MGRYLIRRLIQVIPLLFGITLLVFLLVNAVPGNPVSDLAFQPGVRPEDIEAIKRSLGLDQPLYKRYFTWLGNVAQGDFGNNMVTHRPVIRDIRERLPNTLKLTVASFILALLFAIPVGVYAAVRRNTWFDNLATFGAVAGVAIPRFWFALMMILIFAVTLRWLPSGGTQAYGGGGLGDQLKHLIMPAITLAIAEMAGWTRYIRGQMLEVIRQDYIRTATAKGLRERVVIFRHALRNAAIPVLTIVGLQFGGLLAGAVIIEQVFAWPGVGRIAVNAISSRDYPIVQASVLVISTAFVLMNLVVDVMYAWLDPRIRVSG